MHACMEPLWIISFFLLKFLYFSYIWIQIEITLCKNFRSPQDLHLTRRYILFSYCKFFDTQIIDQRLHNMDRKDKILQCYVQSVFVGWQKRLCARPHIAGLAKIWMISLSEIVFLCLIKHVSLEVWLESKNIYFIFLGEQMWTFVQ